MEAATRARGRKPPNVEEMTREQIRQAILKKRESSARAQRIVEQLLERGVPEALFLRCLPDINLAHLQDVAEERAVSRLCGYPLCDAPLLDDIPKQRYKISMKTNKVYDITARKNFCSNRCYNATVYVEKQMLTSPLWFREHEEIPVFQLLPSDAPGSIGREIDLSLIEKIKVTKDKINFTSINEFASATFSEMSPGDQKEHECSGENKNDDHNLEVSKSHEILTEIKLENLKPTEMKPEVLHTKTCVGAASMDTSHSVPEILHQKQDTQATKSPLKSTPHNNPNRNSLNIIGEIFERPEKKIDPIITSMMHEKKEAQKPAPKKTPQRKKINTIETIIIHVEKCIAEWFTLDSMILLFGEEKVKGMVADKGDCIKEYLNNMANGLFYSSTSYDHYQKLCRKLNMLELEDHRYDSKVINRETKPLPDYSIIKEEGKRLELKVRSYLCGETEIPESKPDEPKPQEEEDPSNLTQLALVDKKSQNALRRKILLTNLNKVLHDLQASLGLQEFSIASNVRLLVNSFNLKANNIMFKPVQWMLIGIIMIKLISLKDPSITHALETTSANHNLQLLLLSYKQDGGYLDRLLLWLTDIDRLLDTNATQLTVESS